MCYISRVFLVTLIMFYDCACAGSLEKYCSENRFQSRDNNDLQFTKELSSAEYAVSNTTTKILYCCAKGYRSIEWFKDDKPYPWPVGVSSFILNPDSANQSIYTQRLTPEDAGIYTCKATNYTDHIQHDIQLTILQTSSYVDEPKPTYNMPEAYFARITETARLYCEAFVGRIDLPDETNKITWMRPGVNMSELLEQDRINVSVVFRDNLQIIGSYFQIDRVKFSDFGDYVCSVSNSDDQFITLNTVLREIDWLDEPKRTDIPWFRVILIFTAICISSLLFFDRNCSSFCLLIFYKITNFFQKFFLSFNSTANRKEFDIMICYRRPDKEFVVDTLAAKLKTEHNYRVTCKELEDSSIELTSCQAIVLVVSPATFNNTWAPSVISRCVRHITAFNNRVILIPSQPLPTGDALKSADGAEMLQSLKRVKVIDGSRFVNGQLRLFWATLTFALPPPQGQIQGHRSTNDNNLNKIKMQRSNSGPGEGDGILV